MPGFRPIKQLRVSEEVLSQLKEAILRGRFKAGDKLPSERELTAEFQVSRAGVREALRALELSGFVVTRQGPTGGAFVTELSFERVGNAFLDLFLVNKLSLPELTQVRCHIEPEVARLAALNITPVSAEMLEKAEEAEYVPPVSNLERMQKLTGVHHVLAECCGNHFLEVIVKSLLKLTAEIVLAVDPDHESVHGPGEHLAVVRAVIARDGASASSAMTTHLEAFSENLIRMEKTYREKRFGE
jgi:GntR family transcriptional regulator, transcriptional repressor for pyruvate dehydrogenase complex